MLKMGCVACRTIKSRLFIICVLFMAVLNFTSICYVNEYGRQYSVIETVFMENYKEVVLMNGVSWDSLWRQPLGTYVAMFAPVVSIFPFLNRFWNEKMSGYILFVESRVGRKKYLIMQIVDAWISSGLVVMLGTLVFDVSLVLLFYGSGGAVERYGLIVSCVEKSALLFLYGAVIGTPSLLLSACLKNRYVISCIPFALIYLYDLVVGRWEGNGFSSLSLTYAFQLPNACAVIIGHMGIGIVLSLGFFVIMNRRIR